MDWSLYISELVYAGISSLIIFGILGLVLRTILSGTSSKLFISTIIAILVSVLLTTFFNPQLGSLITETLKFSNFLLWEKIIEGIIFTMLFLLLMRSYFMNSKYFFTGIMTLAAYVLTTYFFTAWIYKLYYFIIDLSSKLL